MKPAFPPLLLQLALLLLPLGLPLLVLGGLTCNPGRRLVKTILPLTALPALAAALFIETDTTLDLPWLFTGSRLGVDPAGQVFLLFTSLIWLISGFRVRFDTRDDPLRSRFCAFFLATMMGNLGLILAQDMATFFLFYALMSFSAYGMIVHHGTPDACRAGRIYLCLVLLGEVLVFAAMVCMANIAGGLTFSAVAPAVKSSLVVGLVFFGFGIKVGVLPLHVSLPLTYEAIPTAGGVALSGAMLNAGLLGWMRFVQPTEPHPGWGTLILLLGLSAAFFGVLVGLQQKTPRSLLAYSSISQMGFMTVVFGIGAAAPGLWPLASAVLLIYALHHALAKAALYYGTDVAAGRGGDGWHRLLRFGLFLPAAALAGLPLTSGAVAKNALKTVALSSPWGEWLPPLLNLGAVGTALLMIRFVILVKGRKEAEAPHAGLWLPWGLLLFAVLVPVWFWPYARDALQSSLAPSALWQAFWPAAAGGALALGARYPAATRVFAVGIRIPPGDLVAWFEGIARWLATLWKGMPSPESKDSLERPAEALLRPREGPGQSPCVGWLQTRLRGWVGVGLAFLGLVTTIYLVFLSQ